MDKLINSFAEKLAESLINYNKIRSEKLELYKYSALITIQSALNYITSLLLGLIFDEFFENICFFLVFKILRKYTGGLHSSKFSICFIISVISNISILVAVKLFENYPNYYLVIILEVISFLLVFFFAPVVNVNKPLTKREQEIYKIIVRLFSFILIGISIAICYINSTLSFSISLAMLLNSTLAIVGILKNKLW